MIFIYFALVKWTTTNGDSYFIHFFSFAMQKYNNSRLIFDFKTQQTILVYSFRSNENLTLKEQSDDKFINKSEEVFDLNTKMTVEKLMTTTTTIIAKENYY